jgi:hypothetical protein
MYYVIVSYGKCIMSLFRGTRINLKISVVCLEYVEVVG